MVSKRYSMAMSETLHYLKGIKRSDLDKIPIDFIEFLKENADTNYKCNFNYTKPLKDLQLLPETRGIISAICLNFWCETKEQKQNFLKLLNENEKKYSTQFDFEKIIKEKDIQKSNNTDEATNTIQEKTNQVESRKNNNSLVKANEKGIIKRLMDFLKKVFWKN